MPSAARAQIGVNATFPVNTWVVFSFIFLAIYSWEFLHLDYIECPRFKIDIDILKQAVEISPPRSSRPRTDENDINDVEAEREAENNIPRPKSSLQDNPEIDPQA